MRYLPLLVVAIALIGCNKEPGPGGTSSIIGTVMSTQHQVGEPEVTTILVSTGSEIEHGDYFVINMPDGYSQFYVWYNNTTWVTEGDPMLSGRTGIQIDYVYSESNIEIAQRTADSLNAVAGSVLTAELDLDIITITNSVNGDCIDSDEVSTPFEFDVVNQGQVDSMYASTAAVEERVYLVYGSNDVYGESMRADVNGAYRFDNLLKGDYRVYVLSKDLTSTDPDAIVTVEQAVTISKNKTVVEAETISINKN